MEKKIQSNLGRMKRTHSSTREARAGRIRVQGQPGSHSKVLSIKQTKINHITHIKGKYNQCMKKYPPCLHRFCPAPLYPFLIPEPSSSPPYFFLFPPFLSLRYFLASFCPFLSETLYPRLASKL